MDGDAREYGDGLNQMLENYAEESDDGEQEESNVGDDEMNETTQQQNGENDNDVDSDNDSGEDNRYNHDEDDGDQKRHHKKRKLKSLLSSYEFAPRVPPPTSAPKPSFGRRNALTDWSEHETFVLLEAWGDRFVKRGRKCLRSEEWQQVADRVSQVSKMVRTDSQCRNRLDTLKKKYKKEKANLKGSRIVNTKWVHFKKMDMLLSPEENAIIIKPSVSLNNTNGVYETRGSFGNSDYGEGKDDEDEDDDLLPPKKSKPEGSFKLFVDSINKFSEIYENIENSKIQQMKELEKMRMDFHRELELQKKQLLGRARAEMMKLESTRCLRK